MRNITIFHILPYALNSLFLLSSSSPSSHHYQFIMDCPGNGCLPFCVYTVSELLQLRFHYFQRSISIYTYVYIFLNTWSIFGFPVTYLRLRSISLRNYCYYYYKITKNNEKKKKQI